MGEQSSCVPAERGWSPERDARLRELHGTMPLAQVAEALGTTKPAIRARVTRLGIAKKEYWSREEEQGLVALYRMAGITGFLNLEAFAASIGRDPGNVSRKAGQMGLPTSPSRKKVENPKGPPQRKYATDEERRAAQSATARERIAKSGHPRGMAGKRHSPETRQRLSQTSQAWWASLTPEEQEAHTDKALKSKVDAAPPQIARGSWKAGWREIGGKRNYYRSRWEANYARYLQWLKEQGQIADWAHEPEVFWFEAIRRGVRSYKPDFRVWETSGTSALHEVKGWMDSRSRTCLSRMKKYHPQEKIVLIDGPIYRSIRLKVMGLIAGWEDAARDNHA